MKYVDQLGQKMIDAATIIEESGKKRHIVVQNLTSIQTSLIQVREYLHPLGILKQEGTKDAILAINWDVFGVVQ